MNHKCLHTRKERKLYHKPSAHQRLVTSSRSCRTDIVLSTGTKGAHKWSGKRGMLRKDAHTCSARRALFVRLALQDVEQWRGFFFVGEKFISSRAGNIVSVCLQPKGQRKQPARCVSKVIKTWFTIMDSWCVWQILENIHAHQKQTSRHPITLSVMRWVMNSREPFPRRKP